MTKKFLDIGCYSFSVCLGEELVRLLEVNL